MRELAEILSEERALLEELVFRLVSARGLLAEGDARFIERASADIQEVVDRLAMIDSLRAVEVDRVAATLGIGAGQLSLSRLVELVEEPYRSLLAAHRRDFLALTAEIERASDINRWVANRGAATISRTMHAITGSIDVGPATYAPGTTPQLDRRTAPIRVKGRF